MGGLTVLLAAYCYLLTSLAAAQDVPAGVRGFDRSLLRAMIREADSLLYAREFRAADSLFAEVLKLNRSPAAAHLGRARALYYESSRPVKSETRDSLLGLAFGEFERAIALAPHNAAAHMHYGEALLATRADTTRMAEAAQHLQFALKSASRSAEPRLGLYLISLARGDAGRARDELLGLMAADFFPKPLLDFAYDLLVSVDSNGYLFTNGDMDSYPALALQAAEELRNDVTVVSIPLLNRPWYADYLKRQRGLPVTMSDSQLAALAPRYDRKLERSLSPGELVLRDAVDNRDRARGGYYFSMTVRKEVLEPFKPRLSLEGFAYRLTGERSNIPVNESRTAGNLNVRYRQPDFTTRAIWRENSSPLTRSYSDLAVDCAGAYWALADEYRFRRQTGQATTALKQACSILKAAGRQSALEKVLDYWLKLSPEDPEALRMKAEAHVTGLREE